MSAHAAACKPQGADAYVVAYEPFDSIISQLRAPHAQRMTHSELETLLETEGCELLRRLVQAHLDERSPGNVAEPVLDTDGHPHPPHRCHTRHLMTLFGEVEVVRMGYGGRSAPSLHPLDARNIVYAAENNPLDLYRTILRIDDARKRVFAETGGSLIVLSPIGSKVLAVGALMAAIERDFPVVYVESIEYTVNFKMIEQNRHEGGEIVHVWLHGEAYGKLSGNEIASS